MSVNTMTFEQSGAWLEALYEEATGQKSTIQITNTQDFITVGTTLIQGGFDPIIAGLTQLLDRTIFAMRVYSKKFEDITVDEIRFGAVTRKINFLDNDLDAADQRLALTDGLSIDPYVVKKPKVYQANYYGQHQYQDHITIFRDQLDSALRNPEEFSRFMSALMTNIANKHKQIEEAEARALLINFITAKAAADPDNYINVLQVYKDDTGVSLTPATMYDVTNYTTFNRWFAGYMTTLVDMMGERSLKYHMNITGKEVQRFTAPSDLRKYISAKAANMLNTAVTSGLYNPDRLKVVTEGMNKVNYWQNIEDPYTVDAKPAYLDVSTGGIINALTDTKVENIVGCLFDRDAAGMVKRSTWSGSTPFNPAGGYYNIYWHWSQTTWNSFDENFVVLYADTPT